MKNRWIPRSCSLVLAALLIGWPAPTLAEDSASRNEAERQFFAANGLLNRNHYELAAAEYRKFLERFGGDDKAAQARYGLAVSLFRLDRLDEASGELAALQELTSFPFAAEAGTMLGQCRQSKEQYGAAVQAFERVLATRNDHALADDAALGVCESLCRMGDYAAAASRCRDYVTRWGDGPVGTPLRFFTALAALQTKDFVAADEQFSTVLARDTRGPWSDQATALLALARLQQGQALMEAGDFARAVAAFESVDPGHPEVGDDAMYWAAKGRLRQGDYRDAAQRLRAVLDRYPASDLRPACVYDLAFALAQSGDQSEAARTLEGFADTFGGHPLVPDALYMVAAARQQLREYSASIGACRMFLDRFTGHRLTMDVWLLLADNHFLSEQWALAVEAYQKYLESDPHAAQAPSAQLRLGLALHRLGRIDEATGRLRSVSGNLTDSASRRDAAWALADAGFQRGEWKTAEESYNAYLALGMDGPLADEALLKLALSLARQDRPSEAVDVFQRLELGFPTSAHRLQAIFERGQALVALERWDEATQAFHEVVKAGESRFLPYAENHIGQLAVRRGDLAGAAQAFEGAARHSSGLPLEAAVLVQYGNALMAAERFAQAEEVWKQFLTAFPNDAHAQQVRAQCAVSLSRQDRSEEALAMIDRWEKAGTSNLSEETRHAVLYEKAWCLRRLNRPETAEAFRAVLDATADAKLKAYALLELADLETKAGRLEPAKEYLNRLRGLSASAPQLVSAGLVEQGLYRLGRLEFQTQRYVESVEVLEEFLRMDPSSPQAVSAGFMAGDSYTKTGRLERAAEHFQTVVDRFPADPAGPAALLRLGEARAALHQWKLSETAFQTYLQRFEAGDARRQARFGLGFALENQRQFDDAVAAYQQVATASQDAIAARAQFQIGECLFAKEQYQQAAAELLKVDILYSHPDWSAAALYEAGRCFEKLGQVSDAHSQYRAVVEKFGQTKWAPLAAQALSQSAGG